MKKNLLALAALAGVGLSACSHVPQNPPSTAKPSIPEARALVTAPMQAPHAQQTPRYVPPKLRQGQQHYSQQHYPIPQAQAPAPQNVNYGYNQSVPMQNANQRMPRLSDAELRAIGDQIFNNEGGGNRELLAHWNDGEDFASMGIGHFTWYPAGRRQSFGNTFPGLLDYMVQNGVQLPGWLQQARYQGAPCPWRTRHEFLAAKNTPQMQQLINLMYNTRELQAQYIVDRTRRAMPKLVKASTGSLQQHVARNLNAVANTPGGWYALIDYVNFKGEGLSNGGYRGQNWGLRQVLEEMRPSQPGQQALHEFADAAMRVLQRRVRNSDPSRNEARWLPGWSNRVNTYRNPIV